MEPGSRTQDVCTVCLVAGAWLLDAPFGSATGRSNHEDALPSYVTDAGKGQRPHPAKEKGPGRTQVLIDLCNFKDSTSEMKKQLGSS